jgi:hypothetical protein
MAFAKWTNRANRPGRAVSRAGQLGRALAVAVLAVVTLRPRARRAAGLQWPVSASGAAPTAPP